jgi:serine/threonine-protein kinase
MPDRIGQVLGGRYRLLAPIGTGASATVYLSDDVVLRRRVAVKVLHDALADDPSFLKRFRAEAQSAAALNHPNVMAVHDWGQGDVPYLVTELLSGGSLRGLLDTGALLDQAQTQAVGLEAARALDYAHRQGFVHRDIKPANLLFDEEGRLRIADFGLARALAEAAWTEPAGAVLGTARYASPEQAQGATLDGRSDVYSLALVLIEAHTGTLPFAADTTLGTLMARVDRPIPVPPEMGPLVPALQAAGAADPADRPDSGTFAAMLAAAGSPASVAPLPLAGVATLERAQLDPIEPTTLFRPEDDVLGTVFADLDPTIAGASMAGSSMAGASIAGAQTVDATGVLVLGETIGQPATRTIERPGGTGGEPPASRRSGRRRRRMPRSVRSGLIALLVVAAAVGAFFALYRPTHTIGDYASMPVAEVRELLSSNGYSVTENGEYSETIELDAIISQDPVAGTSLKEGRTVTLTVSLGPPPVPVPTDLAGRTVDQASAALVAASLRLGTLIDGYDETVAKGIVLSLADGTPAQLPKGSPVDLVVSAGPKPRTVPDGLVGQSVDAVTAQLTTLGLVVARNDAYSDTVAEGTVLSVTPPSGSAVAKGGTVTVSASKGRRPIAIPADIVGKSVTAATEELQALGLVVSGVQGSPTGKVSGSNPAVGSLVKPGSSVLLLTR